MIFDSVILDDLDDELDPIKCRVCKQTDVLDGKTGLCYNCNRGFI
tara:strand:- start:193 stop:327 length:135 start_codon:yes stop_codon:yes gene_type:complete